MFWMPLAMAGAGLAKGVMDQKDARAEKLTQAEVARYSPWTGMAPQNVQTPDALGSAMQGGMAGMQLGQGMDAASSANEFQKQQLALQQQQAAQQGALSGAQTNYYKAMTPQ